MKIFLLAISIFSFLLSCTKSKTETFEGNIQVTFNDSIYDGNVSGKLIFLFSKDTSQSLIYGVDTYNPHPVYTFDIRNWNSKDTLTINTFKDSWLKEFSELDGTFATRLIFDYDTTCRSSFVTKGIAFQQSR